MLDHSNKSKPEMPWLDWVRFLAALIVVMGHVRSSYFIDFSGLGDDSKNIFSGIFFALTRLGNEAVIIFFVISGFLVGGKSIERALRGQFRIADYAVDRLTRIYVPLIPVIILTYAIQIWLQNIDDFSIFSANFLGLQGVVKPTLKYNGPLWSLAYETWFYFSCGCLIALATDQGKVVYLALLAFGLACLSLLESHYVFSWILGAAAYLLRSKTPNASIFVAGVACMIIGTALLQMSSTGVEAAAYQTGIPRSTVTLLFSLGAALFISQVVLMPTPSTKIGDVLYGYGFCLAAFSYSLYLTHNPIVLLLTHNNSPNRQVGFYSLSAFVSLTIATIAFAYIFYLIFERNTATVRKFIRRQIALFQSPSATPPQ
jgi:peptidoglycan/LPS O-acetylase OafA/YrhL